MTLEQYANILQQNHQNTKRTEFYKQLKICTSTK